MQIKEKEIAGEYRERWGKLTAGTAYILRLIEDGIFRAGETKYWKSKIKPAARASGNTKRKGKRLRKPPQRLHQRSEMMMKQPAKKKRKLSRPNSAGNKWKGRLRKQPERTGMTPTARQ